MKLATITLAFCVAALLTLGLVMLYSTGLYSRPDMASPAARFFVSQLTWCGLGLVVCIAAACVDYRKLKLLTWPLFGVVLVLLVAVLKTRAINGAHRWFSFHNVSFQPSELAKLALILALAWYVDRYPRQMHTFKRGILWPGIIVGTLLGLIFVEPDRGTTILLAAVSGSMLLIAGVRWRYMISACVLGMIGLVVSIIHDPMRLNRIFSWLDLEETRTGVGMQGYQAMLALGSGGWFGLGLGNGRQKLGFVSQNQTDFILSVIGEELGLVATLSVLVGFIVIVLCGIFIAMRAKDTFGTMLAAGITFLIGLQAFVNIGVVTSALPNKGLALPFISYGGSSLLALLTCVGILFSIARQAREVDLFKSGNPFASDDLAPQAS